MDINSKLMVVFIAALPVLELRGAIPIAVAWGVPLPTAFSLALVGNLLPVLPLIMFLKYAVDKVRKLKVADRFFSWWFANVRRRSAVIGKYGFWGLVLFVAVPLPVTGAWTGAAAAVLFGFRLWRAFTAITLGVIIAACLVSGVVEGIFSFLKSTLFM